MPINSTTVLTPESLAAARGPEAGVAVLGNSNQNISQVNQPLDLEAEKSELENLYAIPTTRENIENLSLADKLLEGFRDKLLDFQKNNGEAFNKIVSTGGKLTTGANLSATIGEPAGAKQFGEVSTFSTKLNLFFTGIKGAFDGLIKTKDFLYFLGKVLDAVVAITPIPQEEQFKFRLGPSLSNFATAIRQEEGITQYEKFTDGFKLAAKKIQEYLGNVKEMGYLNTFKDPDKSLAFSVGAPVQAFMGSLTAMVSYIPFLPKNIGKVLNAVGYLNRFMGATNIDLYEMKSQFAKSQYSGAAKVNFLAGAFSDLVNKGAHFGKSIATENLGLSEDSLPVKALNVIVPFTRNLTPTLESLGRVNNELAIKNGVNNDQYKVTGFKGIMSRYLPSVIESMTGIPAKGNSEEEILALKEREAILRGEITPVEEEMKALPETLVKEEPEAKNEIKVVKLKDRKASAVSESIYDYADEPSYNSIKKLSVRTSVVEKPVVQEEKPVTAKEKPQEEKEKPKVTARKPEVKEEKPTKTETVHRTPRSEAIEKRKAEIIQNIAKSALSIQKNQNIGYQLNKVETIAKQIIAKNENLESQRQSDTSQQENKQLDIKNDNGKLELGESQKSKEEVDSKS
ncbi:MAG: hypothetical protein HRT47_10550 [Candidatus Caenarcaniphilales bacterium]|nr:hypothetical protein [Candidatus Caenarcaniphilales bacterium]